MMHPNLYERFTLKNGLIVLLYHNKSLLTSQISVAIEYGSNDDQIAGTAHFLEHMIVGGSKTKISRHHEIESLGGGSGFETSNDYTFCTINIVPEKIYKAADILSSLVFQDHFEEDKLEIERKVIQNELAESLDDPKDRINEMLTNLLYKKHPVRKPILGSKKTIDKINLQTIRESHNNNYYPGNMIVVLTGNIEEKQLQEVLKPFQNIQKKSITKNPRTINETSLTKEKTVKKPGLTQAYLNFGFKTAPVNHPDMPALVLLNSILGLGESSRLFIELREKRALTYDFDSNYVAGKDFGYFSIEGAVKTNKVNQTKKLIEIELEKLKNNSLTEEEIEKTKNLLLGNIYRGIDNSYILSKILSENEIYFKKHNALQQYVNKIIQLKKDELTKTAQKYFLENNYVTAVLLPKK